MRQILGVVYMALGLLTNPVWGQDAADLRDGDMKKLAIHAEAVALPEVEMVTMDDVPVALSDHRGRWMVVNFWATWCAPCRKEMPSLDRLQAALPEVVVLPVATGRNPPAGMVRFWEEAGIVNLRSWRDPDSVLARQIGVMGLPVTLILNPEGEEVARMIGDAEWDSENAVAVLRALMAGG